MIAEVYPAYPGHPNTKWRIKIDYMWVSKNLSELCDSYEEAYNFKSKREAISKLKNMALVYKLKTKESPSGYRDGILYKVSRLNQ